MGEGNAKVWDPDDPNRMVVRFESLRLYLKAGLPAQPIDSEVKGPKGESEGILATLGLPSQK